MKTDQERLNRAHAKALVYKRLVESGMVKDVRPCYDGLTKAQKKAGIKR